MGVLELGKSLPRDSEIAETWGILVSRELPEELRSFAQNTRRAKVDGFGKVRTVAREGN